MTNRDSDALCLPVRPPQHAAPISFLGRSGSPRQPHLPGRLRRLSRQVRQLLIMTLAWATGLGILVGAVTLVAMATGSSHAARTQGAAPHYAEGTLQHPLPYAVASSAAARRTSSHSTRTQSDGKGGSSGHRLPAASAGHARTATRHLHVRGSGRDMCSRTGAVSQKRKPGRSCPPGWRHGQPGDPQQNSQ
jgi:hypothetical protein